MESPRNETSMDRPDKEKGRREKATRGTVVGFKLCDCPGNRDQRWEGQMMSGNLCRRCGARVRIPVPGLIDSKGLDGLPSTGRLAGTNRNVWLTRGLQVDSDLVDSEWGDR